MNSDVAQKKSANSQHWSRALRALIGKAVFILFALFWVQSGKPKKIDVKT